MNHSSAVVSQATSRPDNPNNQDFPAEDLTGTGMSAWHNPVLPSEFDLFNPTSVAKQFATAQKLSQSSHVVRERNRNDE